MDFTPFFLAIYHIIVVVVEIAIFFAYGLAKAVRHLQTTAIFEGIYNTITTVFEIALFFLLFVAEMLRNGLDVLLNEPSVIYTENSDDRSSLSTETVEGEYVLVTINDYSTSYNNNKFFNNVPERPDFFEPVPLSQGVRLQ